MKYMNLKLLGFYLAFGLLAGCMMPESPAIEQWLAFAGALGAALLIDLYSFRQGVDRGLSIAEDVLKDLCDEKKIKVVRNG
jgi:hypothetical protein